MPKQFPKDQRVRSTRMVLCQRRYCLLGNRWLITDCRSWDVAASVTLLPTSSNSFQQRVTRDHPARVETRSSMALETPYSGLSGVAEASALSSGVLGGIEVEIKGANGPSCDSGTAALAAAIWYAYLNEAARMLEQGYATRDDIDAAMRLGCGYPIGPLAQIDAIGLDNVVASLDALYELSGDSRHAASTALVDNVKIGKLGRSSGVGFYTYESDGSDVVRDGETSTVSEFALPLEIRQVGVVGSGTMAIGITEVFAKAGYDVVYVAYSEEDVVQGRAALEKSVNRAVSKGKLSEDDREALLARVTGTTKHADLGTVDIVVEAIVEDLEAKQEMFKTLDLECKPDAILASTTSSLSIEALAAATSRPTNVIGMHFFNPAPVMKLVEVASTPATSRSVTETVGALCHATGKHPVHSGDRAGFIANFLLFPYLNDAVRAIENQLTTIDQFDSLMKAWQHLPLGPFSLLDVIGNDVSLAIEETIYAASGDRCYQPSRLLEKTVANGQLGRKTGEGFLTY